MELKIITTRVGIHKNVLSKEVDDITFVKDALVFPCAGGTALEVCSLSLLVIINHEDFIMVCLLLPRFLT